MYFDPSLFSATSISLFLLGLIVAWLVSRPVSRHTLRRQIASCSASTAAIVAAYTLVVLSAGNLYLSNYLYHPPDWTCAHAVALAFAIGFAFSAFKGPSILASVIAYLALITGGFLTFLMLTDSVDTLLAEHRRNLKSSEMISMLWISASLTALLSMAVVPHMFRCRRRSTLALGYLQGRCPSCAYELRGSVGQADCPECGKPIPWDRVVLPAE